MKDYIYCKTTEKGEQTYYLMAQGRKYFLFVQEYRKSNKEIFGKGVTLSNLRKLKKHCSYSVSHTAEKLPAYIRYIEQEYGIKVLCKSKNRQPKVTDKGKHLDTYFLEMDAA